VYACLSCLCSNFWKHWSRTLFLYADTSSEYIGKVRVIRRHRVVSLDRCVTPEWPRLIASLHTSTGGRRLSSRIWSSHLLFGRPWRRFHDLSGCRPNDKSVWQRKAWWAGVLRGILATWPKWSCHVELIISWLGEDHAVRVSGSS